MTKLDIVQKLKIELLNKKIDFVNKEQQLFKDENEVLNNQLKLKKNWIWITLGNNCQIFFYSLLPFKSNSDLEAKK